jgi:hypothetical protein
MHPAQIVRHHPEIAVRISCVRAMTGWRTLLRWRFWRGFGIRIRGRRGAWTIARTAFWHALAMGEFEVIDLSRHRHLADAEALARDRHLAAEAIVRMGAEAGADRIWTCRHQLEAGRAETSSLARYPVVAGDGDQRARRRCVGDAGAALDMGIGRAYERRRCRAGLGRRGRWTQLWLCLDLRGHRPTEAKTEAKTEAEQNSGGKAGHSMPGRLKMSGKSKLPRCGATMS